MKVVLSDRAEERLDELVKYLEFNWGRKVKNRFLKHFISVVSNLEKYPYLFPASDIKKDVRRCVISKQTNLYYRVKDDVIEVITIQDSRQDPNTLKL